LNTKKNLNLLATTNLLLLDSQDITWTMFGEEERLRALPYFLDLSQILSFAVVGSYFILYPRYGKSTYHEELTARSNYLILVSNVLMALSGISCQCMTWFRARLRPNERSNWAMLFFICFLLLSNLSFLFWGLTILSCSRTDNCSSLLTSNLLDSNWEMINFYGITFTFIFNLLLALNYFGDFF
jgi:hypothetical protein